MSTVLGLGSYGITSSNMPILVLGFIESVWSLFLMAPTPLNAPGIQLSKLTRTDVGKTVLYTVSGMLTVIQLAPVFDMLQLIQTEKTKLTAPPTSAPGYEADAVLHQINPEQRAVRTISALSAVMTFALLVNMFVLQKFGLILDELNKTMATGTTKPSMTPADKQQEMARDQAAAERKAQSTHQSVHDAVSRPARDAMQEFSSEAGPYAGPQGVPQPGISQTVE